MKCVNLHIQETQEILSRINSKRFTPIQIIVKLLKFYEKNKLLKKQERMSYMRES